MYCCDDDGRSHFKAAGHAFNLSEVSSVSGSTSGLWSQSQFEKLWSVGIAVVVELAVVDFFCWRCCRKSSLHRCVGVPKVHALIHHARSFAIDLIAPV